MVLFLIIYSYKSQATNASENEKRESSDSPDNISTVFTAILGFGGSIALSMASTTLANAYVENDEAKTITRVVTIVYFLGLALMCIIGCLSRENRKKYGKYLYIAMVVAFAATVICDIIALKRWENVELDSTWEYPKEVSIAHFVVTMIASIAFSVMCAFYHKIVKKT